MRWGTIGALAALLSGVAAPGSSEPAKEKLIWYIFDLPPLGISSGEQAGLGTTDQTTTFFQSILPEFEHTVIYGNIPRVLDGVGTDGCIASTSQIDSMKPKSLFSKPHSVNPGRFIITTKSKKATKFGGKDSASLAKLLDDPTMVYVLPKGDRNGNELDAMVKKKLDAEAKNVVVLGPGQINVPVIKMILEDRADYTIMQQVALGYLKKELKNDDLVGITVEEIGSKELVPRYAACAKALPKAQMIIDRIDQEMSKAESQRKIVDIIKDLLPADSAKFFTEAALPELGKIRN